MSYQPPVRTPSVTAAAAHGSSVPTELTTPICPSDPVLPPMPGFSSTKIDALHPDLTADIHSGFLEPVFSPYTSLSATRTPQYETPGDDRNLTYFFPADQLALDTQTISPSLLLATTHQQFQPSLPSLVTPPAPGRNSQIPGKEPFSSSQPDTTSWMPAGHPGLASAFADCNANHPIPTTPPSVTGTPSAEIGRPHLPPFDNGTENFEA
ncbi:hypothetical protein SBRCBS47491_009847 [Sporothrix bragantina]|uniref:Uncharacterized protein n=1 Tax=Sporothrix bragantina TaxID=671064 RepID=A0ABP0CYN8_9PEZI